MNDCCRGSRDANLPPSLPPPSPSASAPANPSIVTIWASWYATASARQLFTRRPSSKIVQAPHCPWSQPFLGPVSPRRSRSASRSVVRVSMKSRCATPFTRRVISRSIVHVPPLYSFVPGAHTIFARRRGGRDVTLRPSVPPPWVFVVSRGGRDASLPPSFPPPWFAPS